MPIEFVPKASSKLDTSKEIDLGLLEGQSALITGGASGIGAAFAVALAEKGCYVTIVDHNETLGKQFVEEQNKKGLRMNFACADVTDYQSSLAAFKSAVAFSPRKTVDIVVPSAGLFGPALDSILPDPSSDDDPPAPTTAILDVDFKGVYLTTYLALHYFRRANTTSGGSDAVPKQIIFISSICAYIETPRNGDYCGSKHAVRGLFRSLRWEGPELDIPKFQVHLIAPTLVKTAMTKDHWSYLHDVKGFSMTFPEDIADVGLRLLADPDADGRAVLVLPEHGAIDLCDDFEGLDGGKVSLELIKSGVLGRSPSETGRFLI